MKKKNGVSLRRLLAHEDQRDLRGEQLKRNRRLQRPRIGECRQPLAEGAVSDLVMVLQKADERVRRQVGARGAAPAALAMQRRLALKDEAFRKRAGELRGGVLGEVLVIAATFAGQQNMEHMMDVVVPLRVEVAAQMARAIGFVLENEMNMPSRFHRFAHGMRHLVQPIAFADGVDGIETQAVEPILHQPVDGVLGEEASHLRVPEIDRGPPRRLSGHPGRIAAHRSRDNFRPDRNDCRRRPGTSSGRARARHRPAPSDHPDCHRRRRAQTEARRRSPSCVDPGNRSPASVRRR